MSFRTWGIVGYGINIKNRNVFDVKKIYNLFNIEIPQEIEDESEDVLWFYLIDKYEITLETVLNKIAEQSSLLKVRDTAKNEEGVFLYFPASLPWETPKHYFNFTEKDIEDEIIHVLKPYLKPNIDDERTRKHCVPIDSSGVDY